MIADRRYVLRMIHYFHSVIAFIEGLPERLINADPKPEDYVWSAYNPIFRGTFRLTDGSWSGLGQLWRRRNAAGKWEYRQDEETVEEQMDRII